MRAVAARAEAAGAAVWALEPGVLDRVGDAVTSQGLLAVADRPVASIPPAEPGRFVLVLVELADPGNAGTLVRAAVAAGAAAVVGVGGVDLTNPKVVRASAGALFGAPVVERRGAAPLDVVHELRDAGYRTVGAVVRGGVDHTRVDLGDAPALLLGNEAHGLAPEVLEHLDETATIDMAGPTESLNVAMAGTLLCFEVLRRGRAGAQPAERPDWT